MIMKTRNQKVNKNQKKTSKKITVKKIQINAMGSNKIVTKRIRKLTKIKKINNKLQKKMNRNLKNWFKNQMSKEEIVNKYQKCKA